MSQPRSGYVLDAVPFIRSKGALRLNWNKQRIAVLQLVQLIGICGAVVAMMTCRERRHMISTEPSKCDIEKQIKAHDMQLGVDKCITLADVGRVIVEVSDLPIESSDIQDIPDELYVLPKKHHDTAAIVPLSGPASASTASSSSQLAPYSLDDASSIALALAHFESFSREELVDEVVGKEHQIVELKREKNHLRTSEHFYKTKKKEKDLKNWRSN